MPPLHHPEGCTFLEAQGCSAYGPASVPDFIHRPCFVPSYASVRLLGAMVSAGMGLFLAQAWLHEDCSLLSRPMEFAQLWINN